MAALADRLAFLLVDPPIERGPTVLCISDGPGATWRISFEVALQRLRANGAARLIALEEAALAPFEFDDLPDLFDELIAGFGIDALILSRCSRPAALAMLRMAKARHVPVIYHLDDDLLAISRDLGPQKFAFYNDPVRRNVMLQCLGEADLVYCSTPPLGQRMMRFGFETPIMAGELYRAAFETFTPYASHGSRTIGYMGTAGHRADLDEIVPALSIVLTTFSDVQFELFGTLRMPEILMATFPGRVHKIEGVADYSAFLARMKRLRWAVALAPLKRTAFNSVKASTKFVEYSAAGLPVVAARARVYDAIAADGAGLLAGNAIEWATAISTLLNDEALAGAQVQRAQRKLRADYSVARLEEQFMAVLARVGVSSGIVPEPVS